jgi:protein ImuB
VVGFYRPTATERHVGEVVHLKLERLSFRESLVAICLNVLAIDRLEFRQREFFAPEANREAPRELAALVDRLASRLGSHAVLRPWLLADAQPEFACQYRPVCSLSPARQRAGARQKKKKKTTRKPRGATYVNSQEGLQLSRASSPANSHTSPLTPGSSPTREGRKSEQRRVGDRPVCLERRPRALVVMAVAPEGPPVRFQRAGRDERIVRAWGPERIETGWWRGRSVRRDYYQVETAEGARYWLFRELSSGRWFLHGEFR